MAAVTAAIRAPNAALAYRLDAARATLYAAVAFHLLAASYDLAPFGRLTNVLLFIPVIAAGWPARRYTIAAIITVAFIAWTLVIGVLFDVDVAERALPAVLGLALLIVAVPLVRGHVRTFLTVVVAALTCSAAVAIGQAYAGGVFVDLWAAMVTPKRAIFETVAYGGRPAGLASDPIALSYQLCVALPAALMLFLTAQKRRWVLILALAVLSTALALNATRTAVYGTIPALIAVGAVWYASNRRWQPVALAALAICAAFAAVAVTEGDLGRLFSLSDTSAQARWPMTVSAITFAIQHPLGAAAYTPTVWPGLPENVAAEVLRHYPHNQFLHVLVEAGYPGFLLLVALYGAAVIGAWRAFRRSDMLMVAVAGAVFAYAVNSLAHNAGPLVGDWWHMLVLGLLVHGRKELKAP